MFTRVTHSWILSTEMLRSPRRQLGLVLTVLVLLEAANTIDLLSSCLTRFENCYYS